MMNNFFDQIIKIDKVIQNEFEDESAKEIIKLILNDNDLLNYFFESVNSCEWFDLLKNNNLFDLSNVPKNQSDKENTKVQIWMPLVYFEKITKNKKLDQKTIKSIIKLLIDLSKIREKDDDFDNYRNWYFTIKILINIDNKFISVEIIRYIEVWLNSTFKLDLVPRTITTELLPKFTRENFTQEDKQKALIIIQSLLKPYKYFLNDNKSLYLKIGSNVDYLSDDEFEKFIGNIVLFHNENIIQELFDYLNHVLKVSKLTNSHKIDDSDKNFILHSFINKEWNLELNFINEDENKVIYSCVIENFDTYLPDEFGKELYKKFDFKRVPISKEKLSEYLDYKIKSLKQDHSYISVKSIKNLSKRNLYEYWQIYVLIIKECLIKAGQKGFDLNPIIQILNSEMYSSTIFKRFILFIANLDYSKYKKRFWDLIESKDYHYFLGYEYRQEISEYLEDNIGKLNDSERKRIKDIIDKTSIKRNIEKSSTEDKYWKLSWYSILRNNKHFNKEYEKLSKELNLTHESFEEKGKVKIRSGEVSPFSVEEILEMPVEQLIKEIHDFKPDKYSEESIFGFARAISESVKLKPDMFVEKIELFVKTPLNYIYQIFLGLIEVQKKKTDNFKWGKVLNFTSEFLEKLKKNPEELLLKDEFGSSQLTFVGYAAELIEEGSKFDNSAFNESLNPIAKNILKELLEVIIKEIKDNQTELQVDYPTHTLNTPSGKVISAIIILSLRIARLKFKDEKGMYVNRWDKELRELFNKCLKNEILDAYIQQGTYFRQFLYLDSNWILEQLDKNIELPHAQWEAFWSGYLFSEPVSSKEIFEKLEPHYLKLFNSETVFPEYTSQLDRHLGSYYLWELVDASEKSILYHFIINYDIGKVIAFIQFISNQRNYKKTLIEKEKIENFEKRILKLWKWLLEITEKERKVEIEAVSIHTIQFIEIFDELNKDIEVLLLKSLNYVRVQDTGVLLRELTRIIKKHNTVGQSKHLGAILNALIENTTPYTFIEDELTNLIRFLYEKGEKNNADNICNELGRRGFYHLKDLYNEFKGK